MVLVVLISRSDCLMNLVAVRSTVAATVDTILIGSATLYEEVVHMMHGKSEVPDQWDCIATGLVAAGFTSMASARQGRIVVLRRGEVPTESEKARPQNSYDATQDRPYVFLHDGPVWIEPGMFQRPCDVDPHGKFEPPIIWDTARTTVPWFDIYAENLWIRKLFTDREATTSVDSTVPQRLLLSNGSKAHAPTVSVPSGC